MRDKTKRCIYALHIRPHGKYMEKASKTYLKPLNPQLVHHLNLTHIAIIYVEKWL
jgi:hypothetical protein